MKQIVGMFMGFCGGIGIGRLIQGGTAAELHSTVLVMTVMSCVAVITYIVSLATDN